MSIRVIKQFIGLICLLFISLQCTAFPIYMESKHKAPSQEKINNWLELASKNKPFAQFKLGYAYQNGYGITKDTKKAKYWYKKASDLQLEAAQNNLGCLLIESDSGPEITAEGVSLLQKAAKANLVTAQMNLADLLIKGTRIKRDYKKAFYWSLKATELSNEPEAQYIVGIMYASSIGTETDYAKAADFFTLASTANHTKAQLHLASLYEFGKGVPLDLKKAAEYYFAAVDNGNTDAMVNLGLMYEDGKGVKQDYSKALSLYKKAADLGSSLAQTNIGLMYENGAGVTKSNQKAANWFRKSALNGASGGQLYLGVMLINGQGIEKNINEGRKWIEKSAQQGDKEALETLKQLDAMTE